MKITHQGTSGKTAAPERGTSGKSSFASQGEEAPGLRTDHPRGHPRPAQAVRGPGAFSPSPFLQLTERAQVEHQVEQAPPVEVVSVLPVAAVQLAQVDGVHVGRPPPLAPLVERLTLAIEARGLAADLAQVWAQKITRDAGLPPNADARTVDEAASNAVKLHREIERARALDSPRSKDGEAPGPRVSRGEARSAEGRVGAPGPGVWGQSPHRNGSEAGAASSRLLTVLGIVAATMPHFERLGEMAARKKSVMMQPKPGPAQRLDAGKDWQKEPSSAWFLVNLDAATAKRCEHKGKRIIDGKPYAVFQEQKTGAHIGQPIEDLMERR